MLARLALDGVVIAGSSEAGSLLWSAEAFVSPPRSSSGERDARPYSGKTRPISTTWRGHGEPMVPTYSVPSLEERK